MHLRESRFESGRVPGPAARLTSPEGAAALRRVLGWLALAYLVFAVAGSLVPYAWTPLPWDLAVARVAERMLSPSGELSRVDVGVNVLLFIPLAFLASGAVAAGRSPWRAWLWLPVWPLLALAIEFAQLAFPPRVTSLSDVLAESTGGVIGMLAWSVFGARFTRGALAWGAAREARGRFPVLLVAYLVGLAVYSVLPLDLSLSPADLLVKWREGHLVLVPFGFAYASPAEAWMDRALDTAVWVPVGLLATLAARTGLARILAFCALAALALQVIKLPVLSRVSDVTDIFFAVAGGALGVALARLAGRAPAPAEAGSRSSRIAWLGLAVLGYSALLPAMFWFPYDFHFDGVFLKARLNAWSAAPLSALFGAEELHAAASITRKLLAWAPLGALLAQWVGALPPLWRRAGIAAAILWLVAGVALVQFGQLAIPTRYPDATGGLLMLLGAAAGAVAINGWPAWRARAVGRGARRRELLRWGLAWWLATLSFWLITQLPGVPYNLPGVLSARWPALSAALIAAAGLVWMAWPLLAERLALREAPAALLWRWPLAWGGTMGVASLALLLGAEWAKVTKLVGTMSLPWPDHLEAWARLALLIGTPAWLLLGGGLLAWAKVPGLPARRAMIAAWIAVSCLLLPLAYWGIVVEAVTDNLVELLADDASPWAAVGVALWWLVSGAGAMGVARSIESRAWARASLSALATLLTGWELLAISLEPMLVKYGAGFSALQFLLSPDRQHYLAPVPLALRYALVHGVLIAALAWAWRPLAQGAPAAGPSTH